MGIRCQCPNGHILNLKSFLAGKRGICPECHAKFIIPRESVPEGVAVAQAVDPMTESVSIQTTSNRTPAGATIRASAEATVSEAARSAGPSGSSGPSQGVAAKTPPGATVTNSTVTNSTVTNSTVTNSSTPPVQAQPARPRSTAETPTNHQLAAKSATPTASPATAKPAPARSPGETAWYVRLESGEQFGPADSKTLQRWASEGRVPKSALLWREGWDDWHKAETVLSGSPLVSPSAEAQPAEATTSTEPASASSWAEHNFPLHNDEPLVQTEGHTPTVTLRQSRRQRESRKMMATAILLLLLAVMVPVLLLVVFR